MIGLNMSALFGINGVSLRRAEIYVNKSRGINCSYDLKDTKKWPLGRYILDLLKSNEDNVWISFKILNIKLFIQYLIYI